MDFGSNLSAGFSETLDASSGLSYGMKRSSIYSFECRDSEGNLKWSDNVANLVTTVGLNDSLTKQFQASAYTAAWYVGLTTTTPTFVAGDTMASHSGWTEFTSYTNASNRATLVLGTAAAGSVDNSAYKAVFNINATGTVGGAFVASSQAQSATTGILYGEAVLSSNRSVQSGDTLTITVTLTAS